MTLLLALLAAAPVRGQQIWFGPRTPNYNLTFAKDWSDLFQPTPQWDHLATQLQVFLAPPGYYIPASDNELRRVAADAAHYHIALATEMQSIAQKPNEPCDIAEGYGSTQETVHLIRKLTSLGIKLQVIRIDGPLWFGHYQDCKLPVAEVVSRVAENLVPLLKAFPDVVVGDVEGPQALAQFPDWQTNYVTFKQGLEAAIGRKLTFLHADVDWRQPDWPTAIAAEAHLAHANGMQFGVIYNSDEQAGNDKTWIAEANRHFDELETRYRLIPDQAVFHTWNDYPTHVFPETDDTAHSWLIAQYLLPRTQLTVQRSAGGVQGRLIEAGGKAVAGARIAIATLGDDASRPPPMRMALGTVPAQARYALLGLRVNQECWCFGDNDLVFGPLSYQETAGGTARYAFTYKTAARSAGGATLTPQVVANQLMVHVEVVPSGTFGFNSGIFPVTPGAQFEFQVPLATLNGNGLFGTATVIFLDGQQKGFRRTNITVGNDAAPIATTVTSATGTFSATLPAADHWQQRPLLLHYAGSAALRAAYAAP